MVAFVMSIQRSFAFLCRNHRLFGWWQQRSPPSWIWRERHQFARTSLLVNFFTSTPQQDQEIPIFPLSEEQIYREFKALSLEIQKHDDLYYNAVNGDASLLSDDEFDALVIREEELSQQYPDLLKRWQQESGKGKASTRNGRVGSLAKDKAITAGRLKRTHLAPMLSLDNAHNDAQLMAWLRRVVKAATELQQELQEENDHKDPRVHVTIVTEPKLDGLSLSLRYEATSINATEYELQWASTRGDGKIGQDVTAAVRQIPGIPTLMEIKSGLSVSNTNALEVRGEVVLPRSQFLKLQANAEKAEKDRMRREQEAEKNATNTMAVPNTVSFSNARNAASGILLRKETENKEDKEDAIELRSLLQFYAYDVVFDNRDVQLDITTIRSALSQWGFAVAAPAKTTDLSWILASAISQEKDTISISEEWAREILVDSGLVGPMMQYYTELMKFRTSLDPGKGDASDEPLSSKKSSSMKKKIAKSTSHYEWGDYDMDGCVHKVSWARLRSFMGNSMKSPKHAIAHKFPAQSAVTHLLDVVVQVGRTGALTPVAVLAPVEVGGVTVQRATLHNFGHMQEVLGESVVGESTVSRRVPKLQPVLVRRAGDVIPQVVRTLQSTATTANISSEAGWVSLDPPKECPACGSAVVWEEVKASSAIGEVIRCGGPPLLCRPRAVTSLAHAFSRDAIDITGLSAARIEQLMEAGFLRYPGDIFEMEDIQWEEMAALPGWGKKTCSNLKQSLEQVVLNGVSLGRFIYALGIRHVGKHSSELVASSYGNIDAFFNEIDKAAVQSEAKILDGNTSMNFFPSLQGKLSIGPVMIESLFAFAQNHELVEAAKSLSKSLKILGQDAAEEKMENSSEDTIDKPWKGYRVVFTGTLDSLTRSEAQQLAKKLGAKSTPGSVSKSTDIVVYGEKGGKKLEQARNLRLATMSSEEFITLVESKGLCKSS
jgi:DNA ligase (NAD+)